MKVNDNPSISIIIPVYNAQAYLKDCLNSILSQTYQSYEVILVDDGSTDNSYQICDHYAEKYSSFTVIHYPNQGQAIARNIGLGKVSGDYFTFIDSDDMIDSCYLERLLSVALKYKADWVQCCAQFGADRRMSIARKGKELVLSGKKALLNDSIKVYVWGVLYKTSVYRSIRFPNRRIYEDDAVYYKLVYMSNIAVKISDELYYYFYNQNSVSKVSPDYINDSMISVYEDRIRFFNKQNDMPMIIKSKERYCRTLMILYVRCKKNKNNRNNTKLYIKIIRKLTKDIIFSNVPSMKSRLECLIISICPRLVTIISIRLKLNSRF